MFVKYEKTFRINTPNNNVPGKLSLSKSDVKALLTGKVTIEEKIDGANVGIIGGNPFRMQKRGSLVDTSEHQQFNRFKAWAMNRWQLLDTIPKGTVVYGEFMWATHHIFYDSLPDWFICFDVLVGDKFLRRQSKEEFCKELNIEVVPLIYEGYVDDIVHLESFIRGPSAYSSDHDREGIVIKNYRKQMRAKIVVPEFVKEINEDGTHWMTRWDPRKVNKLKGE